MLACFLVPVLLAHEGFKTAPAFLFFCFDPTRWEQALEAYERARDMDSVVRLCLDQLDQSHRAFAIVRENSSRWVVFCKDRWTPQQTALT